MDRGGESPAEARRRLVLLVSLVTAAAGLVAGVFLLMKDKGTYAKPVDDLVAQRAAFEGRPVRVEGFLVRGTLARREAPCEIHFRVRGQTEEIPVRYPTCAPPSGLRELPDEDVGLTIEGKLGADGSFDASQVLTKCPSKYKERAARGEKAPHAI